MLRRPMIVGNVTKALVVSTLYLRELGRDDLMPKERAVIVVAEVRSHWQLVKPLRWGFVRTCVQTT